MFAVNTRTGTRKLSQKLLTRLQYSVDVTEAQTIQIPPRIERSSTDILRALAGTVGRDPTAAQYKFHDDPFLIPMSNSGKRNSALAQESGRKAAMWIRQQHPDLFQHRIAEPVIPSFLPRAVYNEDSQVSEDMLQDTVKQSRLADAVTMYRLLEKDGVSATSRQALLEMICYTNDQEPLAEELTEERWYTQSMKTQRHRWKSNELAQQLFNSLKDDEASAAAAYNAMISGTAKHLQVDVAWLLYTEAQTKGLPVYATSFNHIIKLSQYLKDSGEQRKELMFDLLKTMSQQNVKPNIGTLNACLYTAGFLRSPHPGRDVALSIYKEMTSVGIKPSLATYSYLLNIFCRKNGPTCEILVDIMNKLEGQTFDIADAQDVYFFIRAMENARNHLNNADVAHRVHKLLLTGNNYNLIGENHMESIYYRHYLTLLVQTEPLDKFMALYDTLVPNIYIPEPDVMNEILQAVEVNGELASSLLPRLWSQMVMFDHTQREVLVVRVLEIMHTNCAPAPDSPVNQQYGDIAWEIWNIIQNQKPRMTQPLTWRGEMLGQVAVLCVRAGYFTKMSTVVSFITEKEGSFSGVIGKDHLATIFDACITNNFDAAAVSLVEYASNNGFMETGQMGYRAVHALPLSPLQKEKLISLVGKDVLQLNLG